MKQKTNQAAGSGEKQIDDDRGKNAVFSFAMLPDWITILVLLTTFAFGAGTGYFAVRHHLQTQIDDLRKHFHEANGSFELSEILKEKAKARLDQLDEVSGELHVLRRDLEDDQQKQALTATDMERMRETVDLLQKKVAEVSAELNDIKPEATVQAFAELDNKVAHMKQQQATVQRSLDELRDSEGAKIASILNGMETLLDASGDNGGKDLNASLELLLTKLSVIKIEDGNAVFSMPIVASGYSTLGKNFYVIDDTGDAVFHVGNESAFFEAVFRSYYRGEGEENSIWLSRWVHDVETGGDPGLVELNHSESEWSSRPSSSPPYGSRFPKDKKNLPKTRPK